MEDSYTVHRRRKAAARRREKTPEAPKRRQEDVTETDDDEDARARIERMVQETERLEAMEENERRRLDEEKSSEKIEKTVVPEDKPQRVLKRALSPEARVRGDGNSEKPEECHVKPSAIVSNRAETEKLKKPGGNFEKRKTSGSLVTGQEADHRPEDFVEETGRKLKKNDKEKLGIVGSAVRSRREVDTDVRSENREKSVAIEKKVAPADIEKMDKNLSDNRSDDTSREAGGLISSRKTSSRALDEVEQAVMYDENRHEAVVAREPEAGADGSTSGKSLKKDGIQLEDSTRNETSEELESSGARGASDTTARLREGRLAKREVGSPTRARNPESRGSSTATSKRLSKDLNKEVTGYETDSSETEEITRRLLRRKKSPEGAKLRSTSGKKVPNRSRPTTDTDGDPEEQESRKKTDGKVPRRRRLSSETDEDASLKKRTGSPSRRDKRDPSRLSSRQTDKPNTEEKRWYSSETNEEDYKKVPKSQSFPAETIARDKKSSTARSNPEMKKQIIPLSDDSLIEDFERAQLSYLRKERSILDYDPMDDYINPKMEAALRRRKFSIIQTEAGESARKVQQPEKKSWFSWLSFFGRKAAKEKVDGDKETPMEKSRPEEDKDESASMENEDEPEEATKVLQEETAARKKGSFRQLFHILADFASEFRAFVEQNPRETRRIRVLKNRCVAELLLAIIYCGLGAFVFRFTEGAFETFYKCGVKRVKRDFLDTLWNFSHNMREEDWKSMARRKLMEFEEQLHTAHEAGVHSYSGQKSWSFLNAVVYCLTVITTIGYGHISPSTTTGRAITIVYAIFGIPMFLIILADFGKLFTRGIKFLWAFVRRVYYTGSCRKVRRTVRVQEVMKGVQLVYDFATFRRPSQMNPEEIQEMEKQQNQTQTVLNLDGNAPASAQPDTPGTPALSTFEIDDEFNLPISVAIIILLAYIFVGATVYNFWEQWGFFESFYFVFISMSTIGFGDYVPKHPIYMMLSIVYLVFGLALTSMCINVVQVMLSDSFKQASQKIGATIGFEVTEDDGSVHPVAPPTVEIADVHTTIKESESEEQIAPKAKQEDVEL